jgi:futalosine hydrolase
MCDICRMQILVASSTEMEIKEFILEHLPLLSSTVDIDILITGVGTPATVYHLTNAVMQKKYDVVIQAGIAGTFRKKYGNGDVVLVERDLFADLAIVQDEEWQSLSESGLTDPNDFPYENGWLVNTALLKSHLRSVTAISINTITNEKKRINKLLDKYQPDIESMEGAALHYVCLQQNIPFLQIRSISNEVGERDKSKWEMKKAMHHLNKELKHLIEQIKP